MLYTALLGNLNILGLYNGYISVYYTHGYLHPLHIAKVDGELS